MVRTARSRRSQANLRHDQSSVAVAPSVKQQVKARAGFWHSTPNCARHSHLGLHRTSHQNLERR